MNYCITNAGREREGGRVAVAEEFDAKEYWAVGWGGPPLNYPDPEHPLAMGLELWLWQHQAQKEDEYRNRQALKHFKGVLRQYGKTLKEVATAEGIGYRTLEKKFEHYEKLTAAEVKWLCKFIGCELDELRHTQNDDSQAIDWYMSLNDCHREVARNVIWSLKQAEWNVDSLLSGINEMEAETGDVSSFIKWRDEQIDRQIDEAVAEWNAEHPEGSDEK